MELRRLAALVRPVQQGHSDIQTVPTMPAEDPHLPGTLSRRLDFPGRPPPLAGHSVEELLRRRLGGNRGTLLQRNLESVGRGKVGGGEELKLRRVHAQGASVRRRPKPLVGEPEPEDQLDS